MSKIFVQTIRVKNGMGFEQPITALTHVVGSKKRKNYDTQDQIDELEAIMDDYPNKDPRQVARIILDTTDQDLLDYVRHHIGNEFNLSHYVESYQRKHAAYKTKNSLTSDDIEKGKKLLISWAKNKPSASDGWIVRQLMDRVVISEDDAWKIYKKYDPFDDPAFRKSEGLKNADRLKPTDPQVENGKRKNAVGDEAKIAKWKNAFKTPDKFKPGQKVKYEGSVGKILERTGEDMYCIQDYEDGFKGKYESETYLPARSIKPI